MDSIYRIRPTFSSVAASVAKSGLLLRNATVVGANAFTDGTANNRAVAAAVNFMMDGYESLIYIYEWLKKQKQNDGIVAITTPRGGGKDFSTGMDSCHNQRRCVFVTYVCCQQFSFVREYYGR